MKLLNGKIIAENITNNLKTEVDKLVKKTGLAPKLVCVMVGQNPASIIYVNNKKKTAKKAGVLFELVTLPEDVTQQKLNTKIKSLSKDAAVSGIILQLPVPAHLNAREALNCIVPNKDVDGLTSQNLGKLVTDEKDLLTSCTPLGIMELLKAYNIDVCGKNVTIVGRSILVGKPLSHLLLDQHATVTTCHLKTRNLKEHTKNADILITAAGHKDLINKSHIKRGAIIVDVAIVKHEGKIYGDVNRKSVERKASYLSPVPGGVGPMTVVMLISNTIKAFKLQHNIK